MKIIIILIIMKQSYNNSNEVITIIMNIILWTIYKIDIAFN